MFDHFWKIERLVLKPLAFHLDEFLVKVLPLEVYHFLEQVENHLYVDLLLLTQAIYTFMTFAM